MISIVETDAENFARLIDGTEEFDFLVGSPEFFCEAQNTRLYGFPTIDQFDHRLR
jgi:hypothetical protein